ncbi:hypothetical protein PM082_006054 [Marasmius tenuissimus]|nr:hypothetical protein PM082_006054 [Marasmius tenuissimus]
MGALRDFVVIFISSIRRCYQLANILTPTRFGLRSEGHLEDSASNLSATRRANHRSPNMIVAVERGIISPFGFSRNVLSCFAPYAVNICLEEHSSRPSFGRLHIKSTALLTPNLPPRHMISPCNRFLLPDYLFHLLTGIAPKITVSGTGISYCRDTTS